MPAKQLTEHQEQAELISTCDKFKHMYPGAELIFAIPNAGGFSGGYRSNVGRVAKLKAEGVRSGVPDLFLPVPRGGFHGFFIEMKTADGGDVSKNQQEWRATLEGQGYLVGIGCGCADAWQMIRYYLDGLYTVETVNNGHNARAIESAPQKRQSRPARKAGATR
jgi:hypothetical protein